MIRNLLRMSIDCSHATPSARQKARALEPKPKPPSEKANESMWRVSTGIRERPAVGPRELRHRQSPWPSGRSGMRVCTETWVKNLTSLFAQQTGRRRTIRPVGCCHDPAHTLAALLHCWVRGVGNLALGVRVDEVHIRPRTVVKCFPSASLPDIHPLRNHWSLSCLLPQRLERVGRQEPLRCIPPSATLAHQRRVPL